MRKSEFRFPPPVELPGSDSLKDFEPLTRSERRKLLKSERAKRYADKLLKYQHPPGSRRLHRFRSWLSKNYWSVIATLIGIAGLFIALK